MEHALGSFHTPRGTLRGTYAVVRYADGTPVPACHLLNQPVMIPLLSPAELHRRERPREDARHIDAEIPAAEVDLSVSNGFRGHGELGPDSEEHAVSRLDPDAVDEEGGVSAVGEGIIGAREIERAHVDAL